MENIAVCTPKSTGDSKRRLKHQLRLNKQKARKNKSMNESLLLKQGIGHLSWVKVKVNLAPYNGKGGTTWLIPSGATVIAERFPRGYVLWLTRGIPWDSEEAMKANCRKYNFAHKHELIFLPKAVIFNAVAK